MISSQTQTHPPQNQAPTRHRHATQKKNDGERRIGLNPETVEVLQDYIDTHRHDITNANNREPLVTTAQGRPPLQTLQSDSYAATRPCISTGECPHDRDPDTCDAAVNRSQAYRCPSSKSPHATRRGAITRLLSADVPEKVISDRASTSVAVLDKHYDERTETEKMQQRREYLTDI